MKSVPANSVARPRHVRTGVSIALGALTLALLWLVSGRALLPHNAMAAALAQPTNPTVVPTGPTVVPTGPTVVPTGPTVAPTPTKTVTATPLPPDTDGPLELLPGFPQSGDYCVASGGAGLKETDTDSFIIDVNGTPVAAYLIWSARYPFSSPGDNQVEIKINGGAGILVTAALAREAASGWDDFNHHTYLSGNLVNDVNFAGLLSGSFEVTLSGLISGGTEENQGHGVSLIVFYENATECANTEVNFFFGLDGFHHRFPPPFGPNSEVVCVNVPPSTEDRLLKFKLFVGGAEGTRPNAIWYYTGTGNHPTDLIDNNLGAVLDGPPVTSDPALTANAGQQWDDYTNVITVPADAAFACFQIESIDIQSATIEFGTSGVWAGLTTELKSNIINPPTFTPTATATDTQPKATPTITPTGTQPTATPTITPTGTLPTATPTPTGTLPTATPTRVGGRGFSLTITYEPVPPVPGQPLIFTIHIKNTGEVLLPGVKLIAEIPDYTSYLTALVLRSAGWQCAGVDAGDTCEYTVGDMTVGLGADLDLGVQVDRTVRSGSEIVLNVRAVTSDGFALNGSSGTDSNAVVNQTIMMLPWVNTQ